MSFHFAFMYSNRIICVFKHKQTLILYNIQEIYLNPSNPPKSPSSHLGARPISPSDLRLTSFRILNNLTLATAEIRKGSFFLTHKGLPKHSVHQGGSGDLRGNSQKHSKQPTHRPMSRTLLFVCVRGSSLKEGCKNKTVVLFELFRQEFPKLDSFYTYLCVHIFPKWYQNLYSSCFFAIQLMYEQKTLKTTIDEQNRKITFLWDVIFNFFFYWCMFIYIVCSLLQIS